MTSTSNYIIRAKTGNDELASVYIMDFGNGRLVECVEAKEPQLSREEKWVLIISTLFGCPVKCRMCDAGGDYRGRLSYSQMFAQIDFLVHQRYSNNIVPTKKFKIQFARMGEPAFNLDVIRLMEDLPNLYDACGLMPAISSIAPEGCDEFFDRLADVKNRVYANGKFQLQFSIHSTDFRKRSWLIPAKIWSLEQIARYGEMFYQQGDRKITLNFALSEESDIDVGLLASVFDTEKFLVKITPINPTVRSTENNLLVADNNFGILPVENLMEALQRVGFDVILSIGELEENNIGSNCGQFVSRYLNQSLAIDNAYTYKLQYV